MSIACLIDRCGALPAGDVVAVGDRLAAHRLDLGRPRVGRTLGVAAAAVTWPPTSLTTTLAPSDASIRACSRPMPRPAPVTIATLPSHMFPMGAWDSRARPTEATRSPAPHRARRSRGLRLEGPQRRDRRHPARPRQSESTFFARLGATAGRLVRLLGVHRRPRHVHQAVGHVALVQLEQRGDRLGRVVHRRPRVAVGREARRRVGDRPTPGLDRVELVPAERHRHRRPG